jgi:hypothetical protein
MDTLSRENIAYIFYKWGTGGDDEKLELWESHPECRQMFAVVENKPFSLFKKLRSMHWPGSSEDVGTITSVLATLKEEDSIPAFYSIIAAPVRRGVMKRLSPKSKERVDEALTRIAKEQLREVSFNPEKNYYLMTQGLLSTLEASARTCGSTECIDNNKPYEDYAPFHMGRCRRHSFHLACTRHQYACDCESK